mmetsp:Transcript_29709/g.34318  ORF Transcript_29709/g.34318 Transcript_29709/m.34318 type:complete len:114 (+) Transcript_29709:135-476(+)
MFDGQLFSKRLSLSLVNFAQWLHLLRESSRRLSNALNILSNKKLHPPTQEGIRHRGKKLKKPIQTGLKKVLFPAFYYPWRGRGIILKWPFWARGRTLIVQPNLNHQVELLLKF